LNIWLLRRLFCSKLAEIFDPLVIDGFLTVRTSLKGSQAARIILFTAAVPSGGLFSIIVGFG
jgi:hypothetical protein